jgi:hypothetical protein
MPKGSYFPKFTPNSFFNAFTFWKYFSPMLFSLLIPRGGIPSIKGVTSLFFFAAGALWQPESLSKLVNRKFKRLLIPYFVIGTIHWALNLTFNHYTHGQVTPTQILNLLFLPYGHLWYLYCLFFIFIIAWTLRRYIPAAPWQMGFVVALGLVSYWVQWPYFTVSNILFFLSYFIYGSQFNRIKRTQALGALSIALFLITAYLHSTGTFTGWSDHLLKFFNGFIAIECIFYSCQWIAKNTSGGILKILGQHSYEIYLTHVWFTAGIRILLEALGISSILIHVLLGMSLGILLPYFLFKGLVHPNPLLRFAFLGIAPKIKQT